jgi:hypothetical protein
MTSNHLIHIGFPVPSFRHSSHAPNKAVALHTFNPIKRGYKTWLPGNLSHAPTNPRDRKEKYSKEYNRIHSYIPKVKVSRGKNLAVKTKFAIFVSVEKAIKIYQIRWISLI